jgi:hypothetical protein
VSQTGDCDGRVTSTPAGIDCGGDCSEQYLVGTKVTLNATAKPGCEFKGWAGDADCSDGMVTMDSDRACTARFQRIPAPEPCQQSFIECPRPKGKGKAQRWPCGGSREIVYFEKDSSCLGEAQQAKLCDLVSQLTFCSQLSACIAGREAAGENYHLGEQRSQSVRGFLTAQGVTSSRYQSAPSCSAPEEAGSWVDLYLEQK